MKRGYNADGNQGGSAIDQMDAAKASAEFGVLIPTWLASCCDRRQQLNTVKLIVRL